MKTAAVEKDKTTKLKSLLPPGFGASMGKSGMKSAPVAPKKKGLFGRSIGKV